MFLPAVIGLAMRAALAGQAPAETGATEPPKAEPPAAIELDGVLVPAEASPIELWLESYRDELLVLEVVDNGTFVNEGDVLIRFDTRRIDEQIRQTEFDLREAQEKLESTVGENRIQEEAAAAELVRADKEAGWSARRLQGYLDKEKSFKLEDIRLRNQSAQHSIEDQRDELQQLENMYREDELVDATEEIVLKRSRRSLAQSLAWTSLREQQNQHELALAEVLRQEGLELDATQKRDGLERQQRSTEIKRLAREVALRRSRHDLDKQRIGLERLGRDREQLSVRAPRSGLVLHGDLDDAPGAATLERGSRPGLFKTIMTVATPDRLKVVVSVPESSLERARNGVAAEVTVPALEEFGTTGRLEVSYLATSRGGDGQNLYRAEIALEDRDSRLRPGMKCKVAIERGEAAGTAGAPEGAAGRGKGAR